MRKISIARIRRASKNPIPSLRRKLTLVFNRYIRMRDKDLGCISCVTGAVENAGHFKSVGSNPKPSMAFNEYNVNGQCIHCNYTLGGNEEGYKKGLIKKYGKDILEKLLIKSAIRSNPWTRWEYEAMIILYEKKLKEIQNVTTLNYWPK